MMAWLLLVLCALFSVALLSTLIPQGLAPRRDGRKRIVFFDGNCGLCSRTVRLLLRADRGRILRFAPLQGRTASLLLPKPLREQAIEGSLVYYREGSDRRPEYLLRDEAVLAIYDDIGGALRLLGIGRWLPGSLRERTYRFIARNRLRMFPGGACPLDGLSGKERILP